MNLRVVQIIFRKEMLDTLRDKRTVVAALAMPILIYPALFIFGLQALMVQQSSMKDKASTVALEVSDAVLVREWIDEIEDVEIVEVDDSAAALADGTVDAVLYIEGAVRSALDSGDSVTLEIRYDATETASRLAADRLADGFEDPYDELREIRLEAVGLTEDYVEPLQVSRENVAPPEKAGGAILGSILPMLMVVMLGLGAFYPAVDLTAGEKERGTFETLLSTPVGKFEIVCGKFLTVCFLSLLTGVINLGSMVLTFAFQFSQMEQMDGNLEIHISAGTVAAIFITMIPLSLLVSSFMMGIAVMARSFKEAQNLLTPFMLLILFPAVLASIPGFELTRTFMFVPIANAALLFKELLLNSATIDEVFGVAISTAAYALMGLVMAVWLFQREEILLSEERGIPLTLRRKDFRPRSAPTPGLALMLFAFALLLLFYGGAYAQSKHLLGGLLFTEWGLLLVPTVGLLWFARIDLKQSLSLRRPTIPQVLGAVLMGSGWVFIAMQVSLWQNAVFPMPENIAKEMERLISGEAMQWGLWGSLFVIALSPAICEEVVFRGAIMSGLRQRMPAWATILVVGLLFGLFHMSIYRVLVTGLSGIVIAYVVYRSGSIWLGVIIHFINNGAAVLLMQPEAQENLQPWFDVQAIEEKGLPMLLLLGAVALVAAGVVMVEASARRAAARG